MQTISIYDYSKLISEKSTFQGFKAHILYIVKIKNININCLHICVAVDKELFSASCFF